MRWIAAALLVATGSGCVVYADDPAARRIVLYEDYPYGPWDDQEVVYVVCRDYFGLSHADVLVLFNYQRYYLVDPIDLFFILCVARWSSIDFRIVFRTWWAECGRSHHRLVLRFQGSPARFLPDRSLPDRAPPPYAAIRMESPGDSGFTANEYRALVALRIGTDYYGYSPERFFERLEQVGSPHRVLFADRDRAGAGERTATGERLAPRIEKPWTLPPAAREAWRRDLGGRRTSVVPQFRRDHPDQVERYEQDRRDQDPALHKPARPPRSADDRERPGRTSPR